MPELLYKVEKQRQFHSWRARQLLGSHATNHLCCSCSNHFFVTLIHHNDGLIQYCSHRGLDQPSPRRSIHGQTPPRNHPFHSPNPRARAYTPHPKSCITPETRKEPSTAPALPKTEASGLAPLMMKIRRKVLLVPSFTPVDGEIVYVVPRVCRVWAAIVRSLVRGMYRHLLRPFGRRWRGR